MKVTTAQKIKLIELARRYHVDCLADLNTLVIDENASDHVCFYPETIERSLMIAVFPDGSSHS